jgi:indolepyruvate ferredoxin oxidoreductase beta subunit
MTPAGSQQIIISGVGGQGVLFVTRLLAEAAVARDLPVFTSETHGMAQRGGTVLSHLKVGRFASPLIRPGCAEGLIALKSESLALHGAFVKSGGWGAVNADDPMEVPDLKLWSLDADRLASRLGAPRSVNLIVLGFAMARVAAAAETTGGLFCTLTDIQAILAGRLSADSRRRQAAMEALQAGYAAG